MLLYLGSGYVVGWRDALLFCKTQMFRDQVYNSVGRGGGQLSGNCDTFRRLSRRIHHNMGLLNTSRSSNHSSSFRMRRTELSAERCQASREHSQQASGYTHDNNQSRNENSRRDPAPRELSHRRGNYQSSRPYPSQQAGGKLLVENLYMLAGNQRQYQNGRERSNRGANFEPQSPRSRNFIPIPQEERRREHSRERNDNRVLPSRESRLVHRQRSKEHSRRGHQQQREASRDRPMQPELNEKKIYEEEMQRLEEKYRQNVYQLKSPRRKVEKRKSEKEGPYIEAKQPVKYNTNSTKNMNLYYFQQGQVSSTSGGTGGVKTLPEASKVDTISEASLPVNSVASQKDILPKESLSPRVHQKNSLRLERNKDKPSQSRDRRREKEKQPMTSKLLVKRRTNNAEQQPKRADPRKRNQKADRQEEIPLGSVFLPVESKREEGREWAEDILERIILHLECLNIIADYTKQFRKMYETTEQWETLIFLSYKKFYIERTKIEAILKAPSVKKEEESRLMHASENPFILPYSKISEDELSRFRGGRECLALRHELETENNRIRNALRGLYNLYIEKSGDHVNMLDCDNFSEEIYKLMLEELDGISENLQEPSLVEPTKLRMGKIIKSGLLIAFINGRYVKNFAQMILHEDIVKVGKRETLREDCAADLFLTEFKRALA